MWENDGEGCCCESMEDGREWTAKYTKIKTELERRLSKDKEEDITRAQSE